MKPFHTNRPGMRAALSRVLCLAATFAGTAQAATYFVTSPGDGPVHSCFTISGILYCDTLRDAIAAANATPANDVIRLKPNALPSPPLNITLTEGELAINPNGSLEIDGNNSTISGNNASRVFAVNSGAVVTLSKMTITKGNAIDRGGGIYSIGTLTVLRSTITDNYAYTLGGGISSALGTLNIHHSTISNNINGNIFSAGGIDNDHGEVDIWRSTFSGNTIAYYNHDGSTRIRNSILANSLGGIDCVNHTTTEPVNFISSASIQNSFSLYEDGGRCVTANENWFLTGEPKLSQLGFTAENPNMKVHVPLSGSPVFSRSQALTSDPDQLENPRPENSWIDIGAVESPRMFADGMEMLPFVYP